MATILNNLVFTEMGAIIDAAAINGCLNSGLIVIVETNRDGFIEGIVSAHSLRGQAWEIYNADYAADNGYAIVIPTEAGPEMYYGEITAMELDAVART